MPESSSLLAILGLAFGLGLTHALDADHIMAVSSLSGKRASLRDTLKFCGNWAIGHGMTLLIVGIAVLMMGMAIPAEMSQLAEYAVGWMLVGLGLYVFWNLHHSDAHLHFHNHDDATRHAHWHRHQNQEDHHHFHGAVMVGVLHGMAGSAPLLALLPLGAQGSPWYGMVYLLVFGLGVLMAMLVFGGALGAVYAWLSRSGLTVIKIVRTCVASGTIVIGGYLIAGHS